MKAPKKMVSLAARAIPGGRVLALLLALFVAAGAVILVWAAVPSEAQTASTTTYTVKDLGTLPGGTYSYAYGINDSGQVVGYAHTSSGEGHAFLYSNGQMQDLGTLPGGTYSDAWEINDSGQVVGVASTSSGSHAFLYSNGQMQDLNSLVPAGSGWILQGAYGINDSGQVVGYALTPSSGADQAFLYSNGQMQDLGTLPGGYESYAYGINDSGQVVGASDTSSGDVHAFLYSNGQMQDLGTLPGKQYSGANGINDSGQVVGYALTPSYDMQDTFAFLYSNGQMQDLGMLPGDTYSDAWGINDSGQVVGWSKTSSGEAHAFLYSNGQMQDLNSLIPAGSGWILQGAFGINTSGQIVGTGVINGHSRAFLATPDTPPSDTTPPTVTSTVPRANATEVDPTINVKATFSEDMRVDSVKNAFKLFKKGSTTQIAAQVSYDAATDTAKLNPTNNLRRGLTYKAVVTTVAKDLAGNRLDQDSSTTGLQQMRWFFRVDD